MPTDSYFLYFADNSHKHFGVEMMRHLSKSEKWVISWIILWTKMCGMKETGKYEHQSYTIVHYQKRVEAVSSSKMMYYYHSIEAFPRNEERERNDSHLERKAKKQGFYCCSQFAQVQRELLELNTSRRQTRRKGKKNCQIFL